MSDQTTQQTTEAPQLAREIADRLGAQSVIVLVGYEDGSVAMSGAGVNHARANEMLSVGIYSNLDQHYRMIREGAAGAEAAEKLAEVEGRNASEVAE